MLSVLKQQLLPFRGYRDDLLDDWLGFDPNGGGLHALTRDIQSIAEPWLTETGISDDWFGLDPNGQGLTQIANIVGPAVLAYFTGGALGGLGATTTDAAFVAADAAQLTAQGLSAAQVEATLVASGVSSEAAVAAASAAATGATETAITDSILTTTKNSEIFSSPAAQQAYSSDPQLIQKVGEAYNVPASDISAAVEKSTFTTPDWLSQSNMDIGDIGNHLQDLIAKGDLTKEQAFEAMQAYNNAASGGEWSQFLANGAVDDWSTNSGWGLQDVFDAGKKANSVYNTANKLLGGSTGKTGGLLGGLSGTDLSKLGAGGLSWYLANQYANKQADLANQMLTKADPYLQYRQQTEIPFLKSMLQQVPGMITDAQQTGQSAYDKLNDPFYQNKLQESYTNPVGVYNSPEMQALNSQFMNQIQRRDAQAGRNSQYGARAVEAQNNFLTNALPQYRSGLVAGSGAQTQQGTGLSNLFGNQMQSALGAAKLGTNLSGAGAGATAYGNLMTEANKAGTYASNPFLQSVGLGTSGNTGINTNGLLNSVGGLYNNLFGSSGTISQSQMNNIFNNGTLSYDQMAQNAVNNANLAEAGGYTGFGDIPTEAGTAYDWSSLWS